MRKQEGHFLMQAEDAKLINVRQSKNIDGEKFTKV